MSDDDRVSVGTKVDRDTRQQFRMLAAARDTTMSSILRDRIHEELDSAEGLDTDVEEQPAD